MGRRRESPGGLVRFCVHTCRSFRRRRLFSVPAAGHHPPPGRAAPPEMPWRTGPLLRPSLSPLPETASPASGEDAPSLRKRRIFWSGLSARTFSAGKKPYFRFRKDGADRRWLISDSSLCPPIRGMFFPGSSPCLPIPSLYLPVRGTVGKESFASAS